MPFKNPIVGGTGELIRDSIHSSNYVAGVSGWSINRDGTAEFDNVVMRGTWSISGDPPNQAARLEGLVDSSSGDTLPTIRGTNIHGEQFYLETTNGVIGDANAVMRIISSDRDASVQISNSYAGFVTYLALSAPAVLFESASQFLRIADVDTAPPAYEDWTNIGLLNGWTNFGGGYSELRALRLPDGMVHLEGTIAPGTTVNGTVVGTLPVGFRPLTSARRVVWTNVGKNGCADINTNGNIAIFDSAGIAAASFCVQFPIVV